MYHAISLNSSLSTIPAIRKHGTHENFLPLYHAISYFSVRLQLFLPAPHGIQMGFALLYHVFKLKSSIPVQNHMVQKSIYMPCTMFRELGSLKSMVYSRLSLRCTMPQKIIYFYKNEKRVLSDSSGALNAWCAMRDLNPHGRPLDPKSSASANSANRAYLVTPPGIEPGLPP